MWMQAAMDLLLISYGGTLPYCHTSMAVERGACMTTQINLDCIFNALWIPGHQIKLQPPIVVRFLVRLNGVPFPKIQISLKKRSVHLTHCCKLN